MSEQTKKAGPDEQEAKAPALPEQDLDNVAGGGVGDPIDDIGIGLGKKPNPGSIRVPWKPPTNIA